MSCNISYLLAVLLWPYMPSVAETILTQLNANNPQHVVDGQFQRVLEGKFVQFLPEGHRLGKVCCVRP
jgi:methionyl-tRNA synthetase